jgi:hypothetical protein
MKQTAVEWLYEHILLTPLDIRSIYKCLEQAKEMEKEQIINAHDLGYTDCKSYNIRSGEEYYNETFKSE